MWFGTTARRRDRRRRRVRHLVLAGWAVSTLAVALGAPSALWAGSFWASVAGDSDRNGDRVDRAALASSWGEAEVTPKKGRRMAAALGAPLPQRGSDANSSIPAIIRAAAREFGVEGDYLIAIAACESGLDPRAYNSAGYHGLFQYDSSTWSAHGYGSIWNPVAQARTTAKLIAAGEASRWPNCA